jgi:hypothetical protein
MTEIYEPEGTIVRCTACDGTKTTATTAHPYTANPANGGHVGIALEFECACGHLWEMHIENRPTGAVRFPVEY